MLFRTSLVLLSAVLLLIVDAGKSGEHLKKVPKRFIMKEFSTRIFYEGWLVHIQPFKHRDWMNLHDSIINNTKYEHGQSLANKMAEASSSENAFFADSQKWIEALFDDDMVVEVCGSEAKMNKYQYTMYLARESLRYKKVSENMPIAYKIMPTTKDVLQVMFMLI